MDKLVCMDLDPESFGGVTGRVAELLNDFSMLAGTFRRIISPCIGDKDLQRGLGRKILWSVCDLR